MEWLGVLLLYLISGFIKKRQRDKNRKIIESDPDWDNENYKGPENSTNNFEQLLNDLFEQNPISPGPNSAIKEALEIENKDQTENISDKVTSDVETANVSDLGLIEDQKEQFEDNIYHSKLAERDELHFGNKWSRKTNLRRELFKSKKSLRKSIIIKEVLDKPLSMRD